MAIGKYKEWLTPDGLLMLESYARDGLTDEEIAKTLHIHKSTLYDWLKDFPDISDAIKRGRQPVNAIVEKTFFEEKLKGRIVRERTVERTTHRDAEGNITGSSEHIKDTDRYIPADTTAMLFYMKCRMPDKYNDRVNIKIDNANELPQLYKALEAEQEDGDDVQEANAEAEEDI